ncbi:MAG: hypothetical protein ACE5HM_04385 [Acidiferrobacterales bacterium]
MTTNGSKPKRRTNAELSTALVEQGQIVDSLVERILELEDRDFEWQRLSMEADFEFSREGLANIIKESRLMFLKNPLIQRAVRVQGHYVFGQGFTVQASDEAVNNVVRRFLDDKANVRILTSQQAAVDAEEELCISGNLFIAMFTDPLNGRVVLRTIPVAEITEIITDPEDRNSPWFYQRVSQTNSFSTDTGAVTPKQRTSWHPDWRHTPTGADKPAQIANAPIEWDAPIYHVKVGGLPSMMFGVPEIFAALDWATAVKRDLEDYASIKRSQSRFAVSITSGSKKGIDALKSQFNTTSHDGSNQAETNPAPTTGAWWLSTERNKYEVMNLAGKAPSPDEGRRLWLMVSAATGIPETILAGDADVGNLATAKSLDRPTELQMSNRQEHWKAIFRDLLNFVIERAVEAPRGLLRTEAIFTIDEFTGERTIDLGIDEDGNTRTLDLDIDFPSLLDRDIQARVGAVVSAATLNNQLPAHTMTHETLVRLLLTALNVDDIDKELQKLFDEADPDEAIQSESRLVQSINDLRGQWTTRRS